MLKRTLSADDLNDLNQPAIDETEWPSFWDDLLPVNDTSSVQQTSSASLDTSLPFLSERPDVFAEFDQQKDYIDDLFPGLEMVKTPIDDFISGIEEPGIEEQNPFTQGIDPVMLQTQTPNANTIISANAQMPVEEQRETPLPIHQPAARHKVCDYKFVTKSGRPVQDPKLEIAEKVITIGGFLKRDFAFRGTGAALSKFEKQAIVYDEGDEKLYVNNKEVYWVTMQLHKLWQIPSSRNDVTRPKPVKTADKGKSFYHTAYQCNAPQTTFTPQNNSKKRLRTEEEFLFSQNKKI